MTELVLPGVFIEVRPEGLIVPGAITVGNLGVVGTAAKGPINQPQLLGSYSDALTRFGAYDSVDPEDTGDPTKLTLTRALELAYRFGARTVWAVRVAPAAAADHPVSAGLDLATDGGPAVRVEAQSPGTWGNAITVEVTDGAAANALVRGEVVDPGTPTLAHTPVVRSAVNRIVVRPSGGGADVVATVVYTDAEDAAPVAPTPTQVQIHTGTGALTFGTPPSGATIHATYMVDKASASTVTVRLGVATEEVYSVVSGDDLVADLAATSSLVRGATGAASPEPLATLQRTALAGGTNGATSADYQAGLDALLEVDAHIIVGAGQDHKAVGQMLTAHCAAASGDDTKRERIAIVGTPRVVKREKFVDEASQHNVNSDRVVLVGPGIRADDNAASPVAKVTLPGAYMAAAVAGLLSAQRPHISLTNSVLPVDGLEHELSSAELKQLLLSRVLPVERRQGFRLVRGITTSTNTAWTQITTRRIVDYAKMGVRSAATPYIGSLNNERVRGRLRASINNVLYGMVLDEMLAPKDGYRLAVTATRDDEIRGIARVEIYLRPTFSIDFVVVTMFLE